MMQGNLAEESLQALHKLMNVPQIVFDLLQLDTMSMRTFMLADAKDHVAEASEIMQQNFGQFRTEFLYSA
jgi:hypothetical protein